VQEITELFDVTSRPESVATNHSEVALASEAQKRSDVINS
jgi:hypothetical protein